MICAFSFALFTLKKMEFLYLVLAIAVILVYFFRKDLKEKFVPNKEKNYTIDDQFNADKRAREKEIDALLGKMKNNGIDDLSPKDQARLKELSKK